MSLKNPDTWDEPDEIAQTTFTTRKGKSYTVHLEGWHDMLLRGKRGLPMHRSPLTLVRARVVDAQGNPVFQRPLWLIVFGQPRKELSLIEIWDAYQQRYDLEHFFRFGKQRLLMDACQTPETEREENWWTLVQLAYLQLWFAKEHTDNLPPPWERYLPRFRSEGTPSASTESSTRPSDSASGGALSKENTAAQANSSPEDETAAPNNSLPEKKAVPPVSSLPKDKTVGLVNSVPEDTTAAAIPSPSAVQRDLSRILRHIGTPARTPTRRGTAPGRSAGERLVLRVRVPVIKKSAQTLQKQQRAP